MARRFGGTDTLTCAVGNANLTRAGTVILLVRAYDAVFDLLTTSTDLVFGRNGTADVWGLFLDASKIFATNDFGAGLSGPSDKNIWYALAFTKASGTATYRYHLAPVGGSWTHADSGSSNDGSGVTNVLFGAGPVKGTAKFDIAAAATYGTALNDAGVEALGTSSMATWLGASPSAAWQFNQASTATAVTDLTGGGADQTAVSGTSVAADPAGWTYYSGVVDTAAFAGSLPALAASLAGTATVTAQLAGILPALAGSLTESRLTPRPNTGTTARPSSGITARPFTGITPRP